MNKYTITMLVLIVLVTIAGIGAMLFYQPYSSEPIIEPQDDLVSEIDTSDWKTYRNEELGFEVKYPNTWEIKSSLQNLGGGIGVLNLSKSITKSFEGNSYRVSGVFGVEVYQDKGNKELSHSLENYFDNDYYKILEEKEIELSGTKAVYAVIEDQVSSFEVRILRYNDIFFLLYSRDNIGDTELETEANAYRGQLEKIISSFKFI